MKPPRRRGQPEARSEFSWCGPTLCQGPGRCDKCDESCRTRDRHAHAAPDNAFVPSSGWPDGAAGGWGAKVP